MNDNRGTFSFISWGLSTRFIEFEEFTIAYISVLLIVGFAAPLLVECYFHLTMGHLVNGCFLGGVGILVAGVCGWKFKTSAVALREKYHEDTSSL